MDIKETNNGFWLRFEVDEPLNKSLCEWMKKTGLPSAFLTGLGAIKDSELGFYHLHKKDYDRKLFKGDAELISLTGNLSWLSDGAPWVHFHAALGLPDFSVVGGHLFEAVTAVSVEMFVQSNADKIQRSYNEQTGLRLLELCPVR